MAEARVARYLRERGYTFEVEPEFGTGRHPDYLITAGENTLVAEVKAFETYGMFENAIPGQVVSRSLSEALAPIRKQIKKAAGQLKGLRLNASRIKRHRLLIPPSDGAKIPCPTSDPRSTSGAKSGCRPAPVKTAQARRLRQLLANKDQGVSDS